MTEKRQVSSWVGAEEWLKKYETNTFHVSVSHAVDQNGITLRVTSYSKLTIRRRYPSGIDFYGSDVRSSHATGCQTQYNYQKHKERLHDASTGASKISGQEEIEQNQR
jgi:hypothetical protein